jgi:hypothetical protein
MQPSQAGPALEAAAKPTRPYRIRRLFGTLRQCATCLWTLFVLRYFKLVLFTGCPTTMTPIQSPDSAFAQPSYCRR